jgi:ribosomal protein L11 methyltransferase
LSAPPDATPEPRYPYVAIDVGPTEADEAGALLFELGAEGLEERDATTLVRGARSGPGVPSNGTAVTSVAPVTSVTLVASFADEAAAREAIAALPAAWSPRLEEVVGDAWRDEWKKHFEPFRICDAIVIRPPWRDYVAEAGDRVIELEPGRAFGTGLHETTRLVAEVLAARGVELAGSRVLDVGCGSGVLALVALALGAATVRAIDVDPDAVAVTRENAARNALAARLEADETAVGAIAETYPTVLANIEAKTLVELAPDLIARLEPGARLVLSGILAPAVAPSQLEDVRRAFAALHFEDVRTLGEWIAVSFRMPGPERDARAPR